jgi:protein subunit release factor B
LNKNKSADKRLALAATGQIEQIEMEIPRERLTVQFSRSGGPGGQNVNKVATKVEVRFSLPEADWLEESVKERLREQHRHRINKAGEMVIVSSRYREQRRNLEDCILKLQRWIEEAAKVRKKRQATRPTKTATERRLAEKRKRSLLKKARKKEIEED